MTKHILLFFLFALSFSAYRQIQESEPIDSIFEEWNPLIKENQDYI